MRRTAVVVACLVVAACSGTNVHSAGRRMIVLGIDGMDPVFLETHWNSLPNLNKLRQTGSFQRLATTVPPQSPVAWSSVITGMDPGGHGIFDFVHRTAATRMPISSMAETMPPKRTLNIGPYALPLEGGSVRTSRAGTAFWRVLSDHGIRTEVIRMPANYPPEIGEWESVSGMGTPDMEGSSGTFTFFTDDPAEKRTTIDGGRINRVAVERGRTLLRIRGPQNSLRRDQAVTYAQLTAYVDPSEDAIRVDGSGRDILLKQGEWSDWVPLEFSLIPGIQKVYGMVRLYVQHVHPYLRIYVSPVNIDPTNPALPISSPISYSSALAKNLGRFYTQGIAEDTAAYRAGIFNQTEFLEQSHKVLNDSLRMYHQKLADFSDGLFFYYFSSVDQNAHMLWGKHDEELLEIYRAIDGAVGEAMAKAGSDTALLVLSDHGFARFDRAVHLNAWLRQEGFLTLDNPSNASDEELFTHVDWTKTQAYGLGLNGLYLNLEFREPGGVVTLPEKQIVLDDIAKKLLEFRDPATGQPVVSKVYFPETAFQGRNLQNAPDLFVGYRRGYRASWQTTLGAVPKTLVEDNTAAWIGDHCMASDEVPGVLLSNRKIRAGQPQLVDIPVTILSEFGVAKPQNMIGQTVF